MTTPEPILKISEASHVCVFHLFFKIKQNYIANVLKGGLQQLQCQDKEQFKIK